ncbi:MAG: hypothetical protein AAGA75_07395 [Cyanobacteria bacterium P01_E01_bin.6]
MSVQPFTDDKKQVAFAFLRAAIAIECSRRLGDLAGVVIQRAVLEI